MTAILDYMILHIIIKLVTIVEGDPKAPFSIATTPRCSGGWYSFPWIALFDPYLIMLSVKQEGIKYHFKTLWYDTIYQPLRSGRIRHKVNF